MSKIISTSWKALSSEEQDIYKQKAIEYNKTHNLGSANKPKKNKTPYNYYMGDKPLRETINKENGGTLDMFEINKIMSAKWKTLSEQEKQPYVDKANSLNLTQETTEPLTTEPLTTEPPTEPDNKQEDNDEDNSQKKKPATKKPPTKKTTAKKTTVKK